MAATLVYQSKYSMQHLLHLSGVLNKFTNMHRALYVPFSLRLPTSHMHLDISSFQPGESSCRLHEHFHLFALPLLLLVSSLILPFLRTHPHLLM